MTEFAKSWYPAYSRRATQVSVLSAALEKIAGGTPDAQGTAREALTLANPFGWSERNSQIPTPLPGTC